MPENILTESQSPQTGQFNSYDWAINCMRIHKEDRLNPLKRVNSILTRFEIWVPEEMKGLNPLKRVNSILTILGVITILFPLMSQSPQTGQFNSYLQAASL